MEEKLIFEISKKGKTGVLFHNKESVPHKLPKNVLRSSDTQLPEVSEPEVMRHFVRLSQQNFSVDSHFYPLGSCTMKYNPKINEDMAALSGFADLHPYTLPQQAQGMLSVMYELEHSLCTLTGMDRFSLEPAAGAHGELVGMMMVRAYHQSRGEEKRRKVIVPDSSHGTNPASASMYGFHIVEIKTNTRGRVDLDELKKAVDDECACLMLTNPNTAGLFENDILAIAQIVHQAGGLLYYDGANLNAMMGLCRPGDMGFDIVHVNLHKTFATPHGGGGPGSGPVGVKKHLIDFLPIPIVDKKNDQYVLTTSLPHTIGRVKAFYGNVGVLIKAYCYIRMMGSKGLAQATQDAIINANYLKAKLEKVIPMPYADYCMHEFVLSMQAYAEKGLHAVDFGKRLLDYGFHAPTVAFPLIVPEALMIEPTETETKETLDAFVDALTTIFQEAEENPDLVKQAPHTLHRKRCDEVSAARFPNLCYS